jgi:hypothetical protein
MGSMPEYHIEEGNVHRLLERLKSFGFTRIVSEAGQARREWTASDPDPKGWTLDCYRGPSRVTVLLAPVGSGVYDILVRTVWKSIGSIKQIKLLADDTVRIIEEEGGSPLGEEDLGGLVDPGG